MFLIGPKKKRGKKRGKKSGKKRGKEKRRRITH
jgi:hypothetical protein